LVKIIIIIHLCRGEDAARVEAREQNRDATTNTITTTTTISSYYCNDDRNIDKKNCLNAPVPR